MEYLSCPTASARCPLATDLWDSAPVNFEVVKALREIMGEAFSEAVAAFLEDTSSRLTRIPATVHAKDSKELWQLAHAIKGTSSNVGAVGLSAMAEAIEKFCETDRLEDVSYYLEHLEGLYERTCAILKHAVQEPAEDGRGMKSATAHTLTVLLVDDSRLPRLMLRTFFAQARQDWRFLEASDATEALRQLHAQPIDVMIVDMHMPGNDGLTLAKQVRTLSPATYIVLVTGDMREEVRQGAAQIGVGLMQKPITEEAIAALLPALERHHTALLASA